VRMRRPELASPCMFPTHGCPFYPSETSSEKPITPCFFNPCEVRSSLGPLH
jgi:hypothetical protein